MSFLKRSKPTSGGPAPPPPPPPPGAGLAPPPPPPPPSGLGAPGKVPKSAPVLAGGALPFLEQINAKRKNDHVVEKVLAGFSAANEADKFEGTKKPSNRGASAPPVPFGLPGMAIPLAPPLHKMAPTTGPLSPAVPSGFATQKSGPPVPFSHAPPVPTSGAPQIPQIPAGGPPPIPGTSAPSVPSFNAPPPPPPPLSGPPSLSGGPPPPPSFGTPPPPPMLGSKPPPPPGPPPSSLNAPPPPPPPSSLGAPPPPPPGSLSPPPPPPPGSLSPPSLAGLSLGKLKASLAPAAGGLPFLEQINAKRRNDHVVEKVTNNFNPSAEADAKLASTPLKAEKKPETKPAVSGNPQFAFLNDIANMKSNLGKHKAHSSSAKAPLNIAPKVPKNIAPKIPQAVAPLVPSFTRNNNTAKLPTISAPQTKSKSPAPSKFSSSSPNIGPPPVPSSPSAPPPAIPTSPSLPPPPIPSMQAPQIPAQNPPPHVPSQLNVPKFGSRKPSPEPETQPPTFQLPHIPRPPQPHIQPPPTQPPFTQPPPTQPHKLPQLQKPIQMAPFKAPEIPIIAPETHKAPPPPPSAKATPPPPPPSTKTTAPPPPPLTTDSGPKKLLAGRISSFGRSTEPSSIFANSSPAGPASGLVDSTSYTIAGGSSNHAEKFVITNARFKFANKNEIPKPRKFSGAAKLYPSGRGTSVPLNLTWF